MDLWEFRVTFPARYPQGVEHENRNGHYFKAQSFAEANVVVAAECPGEQFDITKHRLVTSEVAKADYLKQFSRKA